MTVKTQLTFLVFDLLNALSSDNSNRIGNLFTHLFILTYDGHIVLAILISWLRMILEQGTE